MESHSKFTWLLLARRAGERENHIEKVEKVKMKIDVIPFVRAYFLDRMLRRDREREKNIMDKKPPLRDSTTYLLIIIFVCDFPVVLLRPIILTKSIMPFGVWIIIIE